MHLPPPKRDKTYFFCKPIGAGSESDGEVAVPTAQTDAFRLVHDGRGALGSFIDNLGEQGASKAKPPLERVVI
jgi:hypothetical protein